MVTLFVKGAGAVSTTFIVHTNLNIILTDVQSVMYNVASVGHVTKKINTTQNDADNLA